MSEQVVYRKAVEVGVVFSAPERVTFGHQPERKREPLSVWYLSGDPEDWQYIVLGTGLELPDHGAYWDNAEVVSTVVMDGYYAFHLCRLGRKR